MALEFNIDDKVTAGGTSDFNYGTAPFFIAGWVFRMVDGFHVVFDKRSASFIGGLLIIRDNARGNVVRLRIGNVERDGTVAITLNTWYHIAVVRVTGDNVIFYVNGDVDVVRTGYSSKTFSATQIATIGLAFDGASPMTGIIDEMVTAARAPSNDEIAQIGKSRTKFNSLNLPNLAGYWPMDDQPAGTSADGDIVRDLSGNNKFGTGDNGPNNIGLTWRGGVLSYPGDAIFVDAPVTPPPLIELAAMTKIIGRKPIQQYGIRTN